MAAPDSHEDTDTPDDVGMPYLVSAPLRQRLDLIHHLLEFGDRIVLIEGEPGSGRTSMLAAVCAEADAGWTVLQPDPATLDRPASLLAFLGDGLGLAADLAAAAASEIEGEVTRALRRMDADHEICLLAIDDGDALPEQVLDALIRLAHASESGRARVLVTAARGSGLVARVQQRSPEPALVHVVDVPALSTVQVAELIELFMRDAPPAAAPGTIDAARLGAESLGNPARVLAALRAATAAPSGAATERPHGWPSPRAIGAGVAVLVAALGTIAVLSRDPPPPQTVEVSLPPRTPPASTPPGAGEAMPVNGTFGQPDRAAGAEPTIPEPAPAVTGLPPFLVPETPIDGSAGIGSDLPVATPAADAPAATPEIPDAGPGATAVPVERPAPTVSNAPLGVTAGAAISGPAVPGTDGAPAAAPARSDPLPPRAAPLPAAPPTPAPAKKPYSAEWVLTQNANSYVIQLVGVRDRAAAVRFLRENSSGHPGTIIELTHEHAPWYVVILGHFRDREQALAALEDLPPALSRFQPWARPVASLKQ